jgi:hypothetical protein
MLLEPPSALLLRADRSERSTTLALSSAVLAPWPHRAAAAVQLCKLLLLLRLGAYRRAVPASKAVAWPPEHASSV